MTNVREQLATKLKERNLHTPKGTKVIKPGAVPMPTPAPQPTIPTAITRRQSIYSNLKSVDGNDLDTVLEQMGADFTATKVDLHFDVTEENRVTLDDKVAVVREDDTTQYLGVIGRGRPIVQYKDALRFTEIFAQEGQAEYQYGGTVSNGARAFLVMKASECFEVAKGDEITCHFFVQTSHDSSKSLTIVPTPIREKNGAVFIHPKLSVVKIKHTKNVADRMALARRSIGKIKTYFAEFEQSFHELASVELKDKVLQTYLEMVFPDSKDNSKQAENRRDKVKDLLMTEPSLQLPNVKGTLLGAYFAVVTFCDVYLTTRSKEGKDKLTAHIDSKVAISSASAKHKAEALGFALRMKKRLVDGNIAKH